MYTASLMRVSTEGGDARVEIGRSGPVLGDRFRDRKDPAVHSSWVHGLILTHLFLARVVVHSMRAIVSHELPTHVSLYVRM